MSDFDNLIRSLMDATRRANIQNTTIGDSAPRFKQLLEDLDDNDSELYGVSARTGIEEVGIVRYARFNYANFDYANFGYDGGSEEIDFKYA